MLKRGSGLVGGFAAFVLLLSGGCAVNPLTSQSDARREVVAEREVLADAVKAVETAPWPRVEEVSFISRITGAASDDRMTRSKAVDVYLEALQPEGARFFMLAGDANANLAAADRLLAAADGALAAPRLTMNDVVMLETAIQALRENRQIYVNAAKQLEKDGEPVDETRLNAIRDSYASAIRELGRSADALADKIEQDSTENYAAPEPLHRRNFSGV
ncbi:hypothetical protein [Hyphococcus luteus]|uniref:Uncharacterized protein n=1 Tax=Hyphococcus luteus TaxID=2058213 RepID=A0A2S7K7D5_9PROT|nr:hypothetical protein [Marinicaulis flavus]PQA88378.1 hypothetical protein CW354_08760 [Marinicaulis flavus]